VLGYIGLCLVSQTVAQHLFARALGPQLATVERLTMLPLPGWGPVQWRGIAVTRAASLVSRVTLVPPTVTPPEVIAKGPDTPQVHALRTFLLVRLFWDWARFPVVDMGFQEQRPDNVTCAIIPSLLLEPRHAHDHCQFCSCYRAVCWRPMPAFSSTISTGCGGQKNFQPVISLHTLHGDVSPVYG
jgi:hypothetical protein